MIDVVTDSSGPRRSARAPIPSKTPLNATRLVTIAARHRAGERRKIAATPTNSEHQSALLAALGVHPGFTRMGGGKPGEANES